MTPRTGVERRSPHGLTSVEVCAGAGGQALGLEQAGFGHEAVVEADADACETLRRNRGAQWKVIEDDMANVDGRAFRGADLLAGGVPCPPFSIAGRQLGQDDDRDLFPQALRLVEEVSPRAVLLENVRGLGTRRFDSYRSQVLARLRNLGYETWWDLVHASEHGVPQLRPRFVLVAVRQPWAGWFRWPEPLPGPAPTVGETLRDLMGSRGWPGADAWARQAAKIADDRGRQQETRWPRPRPHPGPRRLEGTRGGRARPRRRRTRAGLPPRATAEADHSRGRTAAGVRDSWEITGRKTAAYRQVGNAFPPPVAKALGTAVAAALRQDGGPGRD